MGTGRTDEFRKDAVRIAHAGSAEPEATHRTCLAECAGSDTWRGSKTAHDARPRTRISPCIPGEVRGGGFNRSAQHLWFEMF